jgi:hypothetical protein
MEHPPRLPGEAACFHPLPVRAVRRLMAKLAQERSPSYRAMLLGAKNGMPSCYPKYHYPDFWTRTANLLDEESNWPGLSL